MLARQHAGARTGFEPKAYSASPVGASFLVLGLSRSTGSILTDPTLPLKDVNAKLNGIPVAVGYTFGVFGKLALVTLAVPYAWGDVSGLVFEQARSVSRSGLTDARAKFSINLLGNPAAGLREFVKTPRTTIVGTSLTVTPPSGQYDGTKLITSAPTGGGSSRRSVCPCRGDRGTSTPMSGSGCSPTTRTSSPAAKTRSQDRVVALQGHASYSFKPRLWAAIDATWYEGGGASVDGGAPAGAMNNSRLGATVSFPMGRRQSFKVAYSSGVSARTGTNFRTLSIGYQFLHFGKL